MSFTSSEIQTLKAFFSQNPVSKAFLFGSYSRDEETSQSDIDILVELDYSKHIGLGFIKMKQDLEKILRRKVDLVSTQAVSKHIRPFIEKDKKLIYDRSVE
jgi:uncharacterized protein